MSCYFQTKKTALWNPSNAVARIFTEQIETVSQILGVDSGLTHIIEDECEIDGALFVPFANLLRERLSTTNNLALRALLQGVSDVCTVIAYRGDWDLTPEFREMNPWQETHERIAWSMPVGQ
ncbi:DUF6086 family protein [Streptomyces sp. XM4193]|uniref:DUF6086 family protein n=1 Tax=Streptomyces sp. XM4193 TaxID=2929782 RepID=UPI001FFC05C3|nr:DUF6086 family protein [Streptomyces sp. XM4193]MCK1799134.1 DUF6086 family protein [Streptomyces sp. XM4193]